MKYIDDTKFMQSIQNEEDVELLQTAVDSLYQWQIFNNMQFNSDKFQVFRMDKSHDIKESTQLFTRGILHTITQVEQAKDLHIQMDDVGNFKPQMLDAISKTR